MRLKTNRMTSEGNKKGVAFDIDIGTGHHQGKNQEERVRKHLEQEEREVGLAGLTD